MSNTYKTPAELAREMYQTPITGAAALERAIAAAYVALLDEAERVINSRMPDDWDESLHGFRDELQKQAGGE
jgi:hypothetical protein